MKKNTLITVLLINIFLSIILSAILFTAQRLLSTPFPAFGLFDLMARTLDGRILTFGIDSLIGVIRFLHLGRTDTTAKLAEQLMAVGLFFVLAFLSSVIYWLTMRRFFAHPSRRHSLVSGLILALVFGLPISAITLNLDRASLIGPMISALWLTAVFVGWGLIHGTMYHALQPVAQPATPDPSVRAIHRRTFLIRLGCATAMITLTEACL